MRTNTKSKSHFKIKMKQMKRAKKEPVKQLQSFYSREKSWCEAGDDQSLFIGPGTCGVALVVTFNARNFPPRLKNPF